MLLRLRNQTSSQQSQPNCQQRGALSGTITAAQQRRDVLAVTFTRPNLQSGAVHCGSLTHQYIYTSYTWIPPGFSKAKLTSGKYFFFPGLNVTSSFLFPWFFPSCCQQDSVTVPSARSPGSQAEHVHRRRADSSKGPSADPPLLCTYLKKTWKAAHSCIPSVY